MPKGRWNDYAIADRTGIYYLAKPGCGFGGGWCYHPANARTWPTRDEAREQADLMGYQSHPVVAIPCHPDDPETPATR